MGKSENFNKEKIAKSGKSQIRRNLFEENKKTS